MRTVMGWMFRKLCRWEVVVRLGWLPMTLEIFGLHNLESEVAGGACGGLSYAAHSYSNIK